MSQVFWNSTANWRVPFAVLRRMPERETHRRGHPDRRRAADHHRADRARDFLRGAAAHVDFLSWQLALIDHHDRVALPIDCRKHVSYPRSRRSNGIGRSADSLSRPVGPFRFPRMISMSPQYSQSNWRQGPHGGVGASVSATTAMRVKTEWPSESALTSATRSAQSVRP